MIDAPAARPGRIYWLVALLAIVVFLNSLKNGLVYDSSFMIGSNATFREIAQEETVGAKIAGLGRLFEEGFWDGVNRAVDPSRRILGQGLYRPMMMVVLGGSYVFFGMTATPAILLSLLFHVLTSLLVVRLAFRLSTSRQVAAIAGLLFAVHPLHSEAVAYAVGVGETQATFFALLALFLYGNAMKNDTTRWGRYALSLLCYAIALFTKESAAALLVLLPLFDLARRTEAPPMRRRLLAYAGFAVVIAINIAIRWEVVGRLVPDTTLISELDNPLIQSGFGERLATGVTLFARAIHLFVAPIGQSADYSFNQLPVVQNLLEPASLSAFLLLAVMTIGAWKTLRTQPALGFGLFFFLFGFGPLSNIPVSHGTIFAERILYLPTVGLALVAGVLLSRLLDYLARKSDGAVRAARAILISLLVVFAILCATRNRVYATQNSLCTDMVKTAPNSARAHYMFGENERRKRVEEKAGDIARAISSYNRAIEIWPNFLQAHMQLAFAYAAQGNIQLAIQRLQLLVNALNKNPETREVSREMVKQLEAGIKQLAGRAPEIADPKERERAIQQLIDDVEERYRANPDDIQAICDMVSTFFEFGRGDEAWNVLDNALLAHPDDARLKAVALPHLVIRGQIDRMKQYLVDLRAAENSDARLAGLLYEATDAYASVEDAARKGDIAGYDAAIEKAEEIVNRCITEGSTRGHAFFLRAKLHRLRGNNEAAFEDLKQGLTNEPSASYIIEELAKLFTAMKKFDDAALQFFTTLQRDQPTVAEDSKFQFAYARFLAGMGRYEDALAKVERAIALGSNNSGPQAFLGATLMKLERYDEAIARLSKAEADLKLESPDLLEVMGNAYFELERFEDAEKVFRRALSRAETLAQTEPSWISFARVSIPFHLGKTLLRIPAKEGEGFELLNKNRELFASMLAAAPATGPERVAITTQLGYAQRQLAWGYANSTTQKDVKLAIELLETALQACLEVKAMEAARDIGGDLAELLEANGDVPRANEVRALIG